MTNHDNVRSALVVAVGTSAGAIAQILRWLLAGFGGVERLGVLHVDSDRTMSFAHMPTRLVQSNGPSGWNPNAFVHTPPPSEDFIRSIQQGERHGYPPVPPTIFDAVNGDGVGVGGLVPLGNLVGVLHEPQIGGAVRRAINRITNYSSENNDHSDAPLMVFEISGCLGGTWGALEPVHDVIVSVAKSMATQVAFQRTMLVPGQQPTKDMHASMSNSAAWLQEFTARASARYLFVHRSNNGHMPEIQAAQTNPTWVVSDMNNAEGRSSSLGTSALLTIVAHWHRLWVSTPLGPRLEQVLVDFRADALESDARGERRVGRSFGISFITLNHDRIERFASSRLVRSSLEAILTAIEPEDVVADARCFNRAHQLHEGAGFSEISTTIRTNDPTGRPAVDQAARLRHLVDEAIGGLDGISLLRDAPGLIDTTVAQTADAAADHFRAAREAKITDVGRAVDKQIERSLWDPNLGACHVQAWLGDQKRIFEQMVDLAAEDRRQHAERIQQLLQNKTRFEEEAIPRFLEMGIIRRRFNRGHIGILADRYAHGLRALAIARREDQARVEAIATVQAIGEIFEERHAAVTKLVEELSRTAAAARAEEERIHQWDGRLDNPNGFRLDDDLDSFYLRVIRRLGDEEIANDSVERGAALDLLVELRQHVDLLALAPESGRIAGELDAGARRRVRPRVDALHVQDELLDRHPLGQDSLNSFLRERDREAHERVTFNGTTEHDDPVHIARFLVADPLRGTEIVEKLNEAAYTRSQANVNYELIETPDAERMTLVQVRLNFPPSAIGIYRACARAYDAVAQNLPFEKCHTDLVGRFLPRPDQRATQLDAEVTLLKGYALSEGLQGKPAPLELAAEHESHTLILNRWMGEREVVGTDVGDEHHVARRYDVRVELATRLYVNLRQDPDTLRRRVVALRGALSGDPPAGDPLAAAVAPLVSPEAVDAVLAELAWYGRNADQAARSWSGSAA